MHQQHDPALVKYPHGRGYGHDYMRGGEVLGGYGYATRDDYTKTHGDQVAETPPRAMGESPPGEQA